MVGGLQKKMPTEIAYITALLMQHTQSPNLNIRTVWLQRGENQLKTLVRQLSNPFHKTVQQIHHKKCFFLISLLSGNTR